MNMQATTLPIAEAEKFVLDVEGMTELHDRAFAIEGVNAGANTLAQALLDYRATHSKMIRLDPPGAVPKEMDLEGLAVDGRNVLGGCHGLSPLIETCR